MLDVIETGLILEQIVDKEDFINVFKKLMEETGTKCSNIDKAGKICWFIVNLTIARGLGGFDQENENYNFCRPCITVHEKHINNVKWLDYIKNSQ